ncbi:Protein CBG04762 [Caenorhabditis briggsae]|uniref:Protein CBG04762 n=1 Tax=Caenorhabditis briggsae TaxID=6238 RepID=A8WYE7_CAEBR|nr:Protein CBG04762 [Caenorhabditis briggsae]CAP25405.2 Protein CBG04762 [Caenorhabditis briggsae]
MKYQELNGNEIFQIGPDIQKQMKDVSENLDILVNMTFTRLKMYCDDRFIGLKVWRHKKNITEQPEISKNMTLTELKMYCDDRFIGAKIHIQVRDISENPEISRNLTLTALKKHCDDRFVCLENTYCYKDSYNYQLLDECIEEVFQIGPMSFCLKKLREISNSEPNKLSKCVKEYLEKNATSSTDCLVIKNTGDCLLPDVQKHCDPKFLAMYKQVT